MPIDFTQLPIVSPAGTEILAALQGTTPVGLTAEGIANLFAGAGGLLPGFDPAVTATGSIQSTAYAITKGLTFVTGGGANTGLELGDFAQGQFGFVFNLTSSIKELYPFGTWAFSYGGATLSAGASVPIPPGGFAVWAVQSAGLVYVG